MKCFTYEEVKQFKKYMKIVRQLPREFFLEAISAHKSYEAELLEENEFLRKILFGLGVKDVVFHKKNMKGVLK